MMITRCPNCGKELQRPIKHGVKSCLNCRVFFETTTTNRLLGAAWELRKRPMGFEQFKFCTQLPQEEAEFVYQYVADEGMCHDQFLRTVQNLENATA